MMYVDNVEISVFALFIIFFKITKYDMLWVLNIFRCHGNGLKTMDPQDWMAPYISRTG